MINYPHGTRQKEKTEQKTMENVDTYEYIQLSLHARITWRLFPWNYVDWNKKEKQSKPTSRLRLLIICEVIEYTQTVAK